jgi:hypothetical protein
MCLDIWADKCSALVARLRVQRYRAHGIALNFVPQGGYDFCIAGDLSRFEIDQTSHIKSGTFIECSGGVRIGRYFHPGRGLTIFSTNHNYRSDRMIPYDERDLLGPVVIGDCVWAGANVSIVRWVQWLQEMWGSAQSSLATQPALSASGIWESISSLRHRAALHHETGNSHDRGNSGRQCGHSPHPAA